MINLTEKYDAAVDNKKWELSLPARIARRFADQLEVIIMLTASGCLGIYPFNARNAFDGFKVALRRGRKKEYARITIPPELRNTTSFFYGSTITIAYKRGHVEIWPRPSRN